MTDVRIAVLIAAHEDHNTTRNFRRELEGSLSEFHVTEGELPASYAYDAVVVSGSRSSVYDDEPWIRRTKRWVRGAIDRGLPCLGVCWGHQLLADVLGGEVRHMGAYEIGYSEIDRTGDSRLLAGIDRRFTCFTSHEDAVVELPPGATPLAENEYSNHGFRKDRVFGVQFHPEYDPKTARELTMRKELSADRRRRVLERITGENYRAACEAKRVFANFLEYVREVRADENGAAPADEVAADGSHGEPGAASSTD